MTSQDDVIKLLPVPVKLQTIIQQNAVIGTVAVDGWIVTFGTMRRAKRRYAETLTYLLVQGWGGMAVLGMALRRDVACCKVVGILVVDGLCDMTCQHYDQMMSRDMMTWRCKNRYDVEGGLKDDTYLLISVGVRGWLCLKCHYDEMQHAVLRQLVVDSIPILKTRDCC